MPTNALTSKKAKNLQSGLDEKAIHERLIGLTFVPGRNKKMLNFFRLVLKSGGAADKKTKLIPLSFSSGNSLPTSLDL